jgi:hypothetical protein
MLCDAAPGAKLIVKVTRRSALETTVGSKVTSNVQLLPAATVAGVPPTMQ